MFPHDDDPLDADAVDTTVTDSSDRKHNKRTIIGACAAVLLLVLGLGLTFGLSSSDSRHVKDVAATASATPSPSANALVVPSVKLPASCATTNVKVWYANQAPKGSNHFGPAITDSGPLAQYRTILARRCVDPALTVAHAFYEKLPGFATLKDDQFTAKAVELLHNGDEWLKTVNALIANEKGKSLSDVNLPVTQTMYMVPQPNDAAPLLRQTVVDHPSVALQIGSFNLQLGCGAQPGDTSPFVGITPLKPVAPTPQPSSSTPPPVVPPTSPPTAPPVTCTPPPPGQENACSGKQYSSAPKPIAPVVEPPSGGYVPRGSSTPVNHPYTPPPAPPASAGAGSGSGMISTVTPPPTTAPAAGGETTTSPTENPVGPPGIN